VPDLLNAGGDAAEEKEEDSEPEYDSSTLSEAPNNQCWAPAVLTSLDSGSATENNCTICWRNSCDCRCTSMDVLPSCAVKEKDSLRSSERSGRRHGTEIFDEVEIYESDVEFTILSNLSYRQRVASIPLKSDLNTHNTHESFQTFSA
jgi:hypothetical protein